MRKATRTQWIKCSIAILFVSDIPDLGEKLVGTDRSSFHLRHLHHQKDSLVVLEEI